MKIRQVAAGLMAVSLMAVNLWAQAGRDAADREDVTAEQPNAAHTKSSLTRLLERYPPTVRTVLALDPALMTNPEYMSPYPALTVFLKAHPEVARNPAYYMGNPDERFERRPRVFEQLVVFAGFAMGIALLTWLIRTLIDYRRWHRLSKVQTDVHTKLLDRFTSNDDLLAYVQSPAGAKFLQSSPITLDASPRSMGAPLGRILWSLQAGLVILAAGIGLQVAGAQVVDDAAQSLHVLGILGVALGVGFVASALVSYAISQRMGLLEIPVARTENGAQG